MDKERPLTCRECAYLFFGTLVCISFVLIAIFSDWPWSDSPWTALSAVATFAAVFVALRLGLAEERRAAEQRSATTKLCVEAARKDLYSIHNAIEFALYRLDLMACNLNIVSKDNKWMQTVYRDVVERLEKMEFSTYGSIARWLPSIDQDVAIAIVRIEAASSRVPVAGASFLFPLTYDTTNSSLAASVCLAFLRRLEPVAEDLQFLLGLPAHDELLPKIEKLKNLLEPIKKRGDLDPSQGKS